MPVYDSIADQALEFQAFDVEAQFFCHDVHGNETGIVTGTFILGAGISQPYHQIFRCLTGSGFL